MSRVAEQAAFLLDLCKLIQFATEQGFIVTGGELARTVDQQKLYVQTGRSRTMASLHLDRQAADLNFFLNGQLCYDRDALLPLALFWEALHPLNSWGGNGVKLVDMPHFSRGIGKPEWRRLT